MGDPLTVAAAAGATPFLALVVLASFGVGEAEAVGSASDMIAESELG